MDFFFFTHSKRDICYCFARSREREKKRMFSTSLARSRTPSSSSSSCPSPRVSFTFSVKRNSAAKPKYVPVRCTAGVAKCIVRGPSPRVVRRYFVDTRGRATRLVRVVREQAAPIVKTIRAAPVNRSDGGPRRHAERDRGYIYYFSQREHC